MTIPNVGSGLRVLVIDDDTVETTSLLFRIHGHEAKTACNGPEAIECAIAFRPHLILLDIGMPQMNGYEVACEQRRSASVEQSMIVAVTGYAHPAAKRRCAEAGFDLHLAKPVDFDVLEELAWLSREPDRLREDSRQLACRQTSPYADHWPAAAKAVPETGHSGEGRGFEIRHWLLAVEWGCGAVVLGLA